MLTTLEMARAEFGFYAAHIALYNGEVEPLHGHTSRLVLPSIDPSPRHQLVDAIKR